MKISRMVLCVSLVIIPVIGIARGGGHGGGRGRGGSGRDKSYQTYHSYESGKSHGRCDTCERDGYGHIKKHKKGRNSLTGTNQRFF